MEDIIDEEIRIMHEQDADPTVLTSDTFKKPISELSMRKIITIPRGAKIKDAVDLMQKYRFGAVIISENDDPKKLAGIFTERDLLLKVIGKVPNFLEISIEDVMTKDPFVLQQGDKIAFLMHNMHVGRFRHIPIVDNDHNIVSIVSIKDVNSYILDHFPQAITNITAEPFRGQSKREDA